MGLVGHEDKWAETPTRDKGRLRQYIHKGKIRESGDSWETQQEEI